MAEGKVVGESRITSLENGRVLEPGIPVIVEEFSDGYIVSSPELGVSGVGLSDEEALRMVRAEISQLQEEIQTFPEETKGPWVKKVEADLNSRLK